MINNGNSSCSDTVYLDCLCPHHARPSGDADFWQQSGIGLRRAKALKYGQLARLLDEHSELEKAKR